MKVICPRHEDTVPSCEVYANHGYCFAGCGLIPLSELGLKPENVQKEKYRENLEEKRSYIDTLGTKAIRGFDFKCDSLGFYILWPDSLYYKHRLFHSDKNSAKYKNPVGHSAPLFWVRRHRQNPLYIVEGEINAMSLGQAIPKGDIVSPGSASDMQSKKNNVFLTDYSQYSSIVIVVDKDAAGTIAAIHLKSLLQPHVPYTSIVLMPKDANDIYVTEGKEELKRQFDLLKRL